MAEPDKKIAVSRTILDDAPQEEDKFSGGGHGRTARALARAIRQSGDRDQAIGLEGSWGAGKSTIVKLAERELGSGDGDRTYHVFTYDLWTNQTGHFKRSFLEAFLHWALGEFPKKKAKIEARQAQISNKVKKIDTDLFRRFSWFGVATLFFLYFTPIVYGWLSPAGFKDEDGKAAVTVGAQLAWLALALYGASILIAVVRAFPKGMSFWVGLREAISRSLSIFSKEAEKTTVTQTVRDEDPTQYEFHSIFRGIVGELCGDKERIVVVFDNIDRLPQSRIPDTWSEVRAAFYGDANGAREKARITAIVPYARPVALGAFKPVAVASKPGGPVTGKTASDDEYVRADVFRKSFDVIFAVAPPVLSDTSTFFAEKFREATNASISDEVGRRVYRIFDLHVQSSGVAVTPRQVIAFINDVTNWWEQWEGRIPLETIAVFVAHQDKLLANPTALRDADSVDSRMVQHADQPEIRRDLAALSFNVEPDLAFQILLHDSIRRALVSSDVNELQKLADSASANGFFEILPQVVDEHIASIAGMTDDYLNTISNVGRLNANLDDMRYTRQRILFALAEFEESSLAKWDEHNALWDIVAFVDPAGLQKLVPQLVGKLAAAMPDDAKATFDQGRAWIKIIDKLLAAIETHHGPEARRDAAKQIALPRSAEAVIGVGYDCDQTACHVRDLGAVANQAALMERLGDYADGKEAFGYAWPELEFLATVKQKTALLQSSAGTLQTEAHGFGSDELAWHMETLTLLTASVLRSSGNIDLISKALYPSGALTYYAHGEWEKKETVDNEVTASALWLMMLVFGSELPKIADIQNRPVFGNVQAADNAVRGLLTDLEPDPGLVRRIAKQAIAHRRIAYCFERACDENAAEIFRAVARAICDDENLHLPKAEALAENFDELVPVLGESFEKLAACIGRAQADYWDSLSLSSLSPNLAKLALGREELGWRALADKIDEWLKAMDQAAWRAAFSGQSEVMEILALRNETAALTLAPSKFYEPLLRYCLSIIAGKADPGAGKFDYTRLVASLPKQSQAQLAKDFFEQHDAPSNGFDRALEILAPLLASLPFDKLPDRAIERYLLPAIKLKSDKADAFVEGHAKSFSACVKKASAQNRGLLEEFLSDTKPADDDEPLTPDDRTGSLRRSLGL